MLIAVELIMLIDTVLSLQSWRGQRAKVCARNGVFRNRMKLGVLGCDCRRYEGSKGHCIVFLQLIALLQESPGLRIHVLLEVATGVAMHFVAVWRGRNVLLRLVYGTCLHRV